MSEQRHIETTAHQGPLWFSFLAGPVLWVIEFMVSYAVASVTCGTQASVGNVILHLITLGAAAIAAYGGVLAWRRWRAFDAREEVVASGGGDSTQFMALAGMFVSAIFVLLIISEDIAIFVLHPCGGGP